MIRLRQSLRLALASFSQARQEQKYTREVELPAVKRMKFSHQLKFNSVPEWKENYLNYSQLKKLIYQIAFAEHNEISDHPEQSPLLSRRASQSLSRGSSSIRRMSIDEMVRLHLNSLRTGNNEASVAPSKAL